MRFYEFDWREMEPDWYVCCACAYLEAKGLVFGENFDHTNAVHLAEAFYREELLTKGVN